MPHTHTQRALTYTLSSAKARALSFFHRCIDNSHETLFSNNNNSTKSRGISLTGQQKVFFLENVALDCPIFVHNTHTHSFDKCVLVINNKRYCTKYYIRTNTRSVPHKTYYHLSIKTLRRQTNG